MNFFEQLVSKAEEVKETADEKRRRQLQQEEQEAYNLLKPIYDNVKETFLERGFSIELNLKSNDHNDTEIFIRPNVVSIRYLKHSECFYDRWSQFLTKFANEEEVYAYLVKICSRNE